MKYKENVLIWDKEKKESFLNHKLAFRLYTEHGVPPEVFADYVNKMLPPKTVIRAYHVVKAYDTSTGMNYLSVFKRNNGII